jgi:hypothetical protein
MRRNLITEITAVKSRSEFNSRYDISSRLTDIEHAFKENLDYTGNFDGELFKYIPIAIVACFEAFFRSVIKELIDFGKPYSDNTTKFNQSKDVKFDFDIIQAIQTKTVTVGEFISHILPCNNFDDINSNLTTLTGIDFIESIKTFEVKSSFEHAKDNSKSFIENFAQIISDVKRTFELRHIFCHEVATNIKIDKDEIIRCYQHSKIFLKQSDDFIYALLYPNYPENQKEMSAFALETFKKAEEELTTLISTIKEASKERSNMILDASLFDNTIKEWKKYRKVKAKFDAGSFEGGAMFPIIYQSSLTTTTEEKIESLKNEFAIDLRRYANR